jgi:cellobiose transport system substrate-binding protein
MLGAGPGACAEGGPAAGDGRIEDIVAVAEGHFSDIVDKSSKSNDRNGIGPKNATADRWLPWDPEGVKSLFSTWDSYFATGARYRPKTGKAWFAASTQPDNSMVNPLDVGYLDRDDKLTIETNPGTKAAWARITTAIR